MLIPTLLFVLVFALPMLGFYFYLAFKEKSKFKMTIGVVVILLLFIAASVTAYIVNRGPGGE